MKMYKNEKHKIFTKWFYLLNRLAMLTFRFLNLHQGVRVTKSFNNSYNLMIIEKKNEMFNVGKWFNQ